MTIIDVNSSGPLTNQNDEERFGRFMFRPIQWIRQTSGDQALCKIFIISVAILLSFTIIGLIVVIPGVVEWNWQVNQDSNSSSFINNKTNITQNILARFDNLAVKGQVNGLYITTNEKNLQQTERRLEAHPVPKNTIHIGCATWHNLDIMCKRKSNFGLIFDFNPKNAEFIKKTIELVKTSISREIFVSNVITYLNSLNSKERNIFFHKDQNGLLTDRIEKELLRKGSWLQNKESYEFIKSLVSKEKITAITEDIKNFKKFFDIKKFLDERHIIIDTIYLSNICNFMKTKCDQELFVKSVRNIADVNSLVINCPIINRENCSEATILHQQTMLGGEILEEHFNQSLLFELWIG